MSVADSLLIAFITGLINEVSKNQMYMVCHSNIVLNSNKIIEHRWKQNDIQ